MLLTSQAREVENTALDTPLFAADGQAIGEKRGISVAYTWFDFDVFN